MSRVELLGHQYVKVQMVSQRVNYDLNDPDGLTGLQGHFDLNNSEGSTGQGQK